MVIQELAVVAGAGLRRKATAGRSRAAILSDDEVRPAAGRRTRNGNLDRGTVHNYLRERSFCRSTSSSEGDPKDHIGHRSLPHAKGGRMLPQARFPGARSTVRV